jgi:hypothetical protein
MEEESFDVTRISPSDPMRKGTIRCHRANPPYDVIGIDLQSLKKTLKPLDLHTGWPKSRYTVACVLQEMRLSFLITCDV